MRGINAAIKSSTAVNLVKMARQLIVPMFEVYGYNCYQQQVHTHSPCFASGENKIRTKPNGTATPGIFTDCAIQLLAGQTL